jgi:hypothetical protein
VRRDAEPVSADPLGVTGARLMFLDLRTVLSRISFGDRSAVRLRTSIVGSLVS